MEERNKEKEEKKRLRRKMEARFKKLQEKEDSLNKSLASSRSSTPKCSPKGSTSKTKGRSSYKKKTGLSDRKTKAKTSTRKGSRRKLDQDTSEYPNLLNKLTNLKHGKVEAFSELMQKALQSEDNLKSLGGKASWDRDNSKVDDTFTDLELSETEFEKGTVNTKVGQQQLVELLSAIKATRDNKRSVKKFKVLRYHNNNSSNNQNNSSGTDGGKTNSESENEGQVSGKTANGKLKSGKCARPDETDIKRVVKYAHEKLDVKHIMDRTFDFLSFNLLVAGEIEIATRRQIGKEEKEARLSIIKTLAYHK